MDYQKELEEALSLLHGDAEGNEEPVQLPLEIVLELQEWVNSESVAFRLVLVDISGDVIAGLMLSQIRYWFTPAKNGESKTRIFKEGRNWIAKADKDWYDECRITEKQARRARTILEKRGLIITKVFRFNNVPTTHISLNTANFHDALWREFKRRYKQDNPRFALQGKSDLPYRASGFALQGKSLTETTTETTREQLPPAGGGSFKQPPIGGGVVVHDLDEVAFHLEHTGRRKGDLEAQCPHCGAGHTQETNVCPDCGAHVVWLNSPTWKKRYGDPKAYLRELRGEDLKAVGPLEVEFCRTFNYRTEFANRTQQREFRRLANKYPAGYLQELMVWANGKGFQALKGAVENPDNLTRWQNKQYEETQPGADNDQPSGWELQALQVAREKG